MNKNKAGQQELHPGVFVEEKPVMPGPKDESDEDFETLRRRAGMFSAECRMRISMRRTEK